MDYLVAAQDNILVNSTQMFILLFLQENRKLNEMLSEEVTGKWGEVKSFDAIESACLLALLTPFLILSSVTDGHRSALPDVQLKQVRIVLHLCGIAKHVNFLCLMTESCLFWSDFFHTTPAEHTIKFTIYFETTDRAISRVVFGCFVIVSYYYFFQWANKRW